MGYVLNGPLKECRNTRRIDKTRTKLTQDNSDNSGKYSHKYNKTSKQGVIERTFLLKQLS